MDSSGQVHFCSVFGSSIFSKRNVGNFMEFRLTISIVFTCNHLHTNTLVWSALPAPGWARSPGQRDGGSALCSCRGSSRPGRCPRAHGGSAGSCPLPTHASGREGLCRRRRHPCTDRCRLCINGAHGSRGTMTPAPSSTPKQHSLASRLSVVPWPADVPPKAHPPESGSSSGAARVPQGRLYNLACRKFKAKAISSRV